MNNGDIVLLLVLAGAFIVGFVWGTARSLIFLGGGGLVFLLAAHARAPLSSFLARQWTNLSPVYCDMVAMIIAFGLGLAALVVIVMVGARNTGLSSRAPDVDRLLGGLVGVACAVLVVAGVAASLAVFHGHGGTVVPASEGDWSATLYRGLTGSEIGGAIHRSLLPALGSLAGPLLPIGFEDAFGTA